MTDPAPLAASEALASPPDLPTPTPGAAPAAPSSTALESAAPRPPATPAAPLAAPDGWDPAVHENPPRRNREGGWAKLRGNAARKAAGLPLIGATAGMQPRKAAPSSTAPSSAAPPAPAAVASPSVLVLPGAEPSPGQAGATIDATAAPVGLDLAAYDATAGAITGGMFGILSMLLGKAWNPAPAESSAWRAAWARVFHAYQWRPLGPVVELVMLAATSTAKRRDDPDTRQAVAGMFGWFKRKPAERPAPPPPPEPRDAPPAEAPPAPGDAAAVPVQKLGGWVYR